MSDEEPPRGAWCLVADSTFGPYFLGKILSTGGVWVYNITAAILVFELSGSAFAVGLVSVAQFGPQLILAPISGAMADRGDRRIQLIVGRIVIAVGAGSLAAWIWSTGTDGLPNHGPVIGASLVVGLGFVVASPAQNALLPGLVRRSELATAIELNAIPPTIGRAAGPAVGAVVAASVGAGAAFALAALTNLAFALVLIPLDVETRASGGRSDRSVRTALRHLGIDRGILPILLGVAAIGVGTDPVITLTPSLSAEYGEGSKLVGTFASSFGLGAGAAFIGLSALRRRIGLARVATLGLSGIAIGMAGAGVSPTPEGAALFFASAGVGMTCALTGLSTLLQKRLPDRLRGRLMALWSVAFLGSRPLAASLNGAIADATSSRVALLVVAAMIAVAAWLSRPANITPFPSI